MNPGVAVGASGAIDMRPALVLGGDPAGGSAVGLVPLAPALALPLERFLQSGGRPQSVFRIAVLRPVKPMATELPCIAGRYELSPAGFWFTPHFPFEPGLPYRATFDPRSLGGPGSPEIVTLEFSLPREPQGARPAVSRIFPSDDALPENLLRFYVMFSHPMRRGRADTEISIAGPDGRPVADVLYHAPVELWDRSMRTLTVLLDPGRLKRGVGPNRELGPPLQAGLVYELAVGAGMLDIFGRPLSRETRKRFRVGDPERAPIAIGAGRIAPPAAGTSEPVTLEFARPLDRAILSNSIAVARRSGEIIPGEVEIAGRERRWCFTPATRWAAGGYELRVATTLEDPCGNTVSAAFERPLRRECPPDTEPLSRAIPFQVS